MSIWFNKSLTLSQVRPLELNTMAEFLGIEFSELGENYIKATMPVSSRTKQPYGLLHGGASVTLAETLGSVASALVVEHEHHLCVGLEINANHIRSVREGIVTGIASPLHLGRSTHVWDVRIYNDAEKLVCISRLTVAIRRKSDQSGL